ncbi:hypothetical protein WLZ34_06310 [Thermogladius sp. KZ2Tp1]|uniref:hypothetical protein n=1 Tax=Thermogladius sp. KZ2Tp1 TaxID=3136289 RepID=UPI003DA8E1D7
MSRAYPVLVVLVIALSLLAGGAPVESQNLSQVMRLIVVYAPGADLGLLNATGALSANSTVVELVRPQPPYDYLYHLLKLVDPSLGLETVVVNETTALVDNKPVDLASAVNQSYVNEVWGGNFTVFIGVPGVDPNSTAMSINPYFNITGNYIPPQLFTVDVNGSVYWSALNTSIVLTNTSSGLTLNLTNYDVVQQFDNKTLETPSFAVSVPSGLNVSQGMYYLKFKIVSISGSKATLFFPGALKSSGWLNSFYGSFTEPVVLLELYPRDLLRSLPLDALVWAYNQSCRFYSALVVKATWYTSGGVYLMYYPLFQRLSALKGLVDENTYNTLLNTTVTNVLSIVNDFRTFLGVNSTVVVYSPFTVVAGGASIGLPVVQPGVYDATSSPETISSLVAQGYSLDVVRSGTRVLVEVRDYSKLGYSEGLALVLRPAGFNQTLALGGVVDQKVFETLLLSYSRLYYPSASALVSTGFQMQGYIDNLTKTVDSLRTQVASLNETVNVLLVNAGSCNASVANLTVKLNEYESRVGQAENMLNQARLYVTMGLAAVVVLNVGLYVVLRRGLKYAG